jgi:hypothetical protein
MKTIALTILSCSNLLFAQAVPQVTKNEFPIVIEGVNCVVKVYKPVEPIIFDPLVNKDTLPKSQMIQSIMLTKSDISSYMNDEELSKFIESELLKEDSKKEDLEEFRASMKKMYALTGPNAEENPWKGMKYSLDQVFIIESKLGKYLGYQLSPQGTKEANGHVYSIRNHKDDRWVMGETKDETIDKFEQSLTLMIPKEFEKLQKESGVAALPLEDLLK